MEETGLTQTNKPEADFQPWGMEHNTFCMLMHLSQFAGYLVPLAGIILPIVMWQTNKDQSPVIDQQGKIIVNWMLTSILAIVIGVLLVFLVIGFFIIIAVVIMGVVFAVIGAIKANNGEVYQYPFSIKFIK